MFKIAIGAAALLGLAACATADTDMMMMGVTSSSMTGITFNTAELGVTSPAEAYSVAGAMAQHHCAMHGMNAAFSMRDEGGLMPTTISYNCQ